MDENQVVDAEQTLAPMATEEKLVPQSHVNKLILRSREDAAQRARAQAEAEFQAKMEAMSQQSQQQQQRNENVSREVDADAMYQQVQERFNAEMQQRQLEKEMSQVAQNYLSGVQKGRESYEDFDDVTADFDPTAFPQLTYLLAGMDNAGDVVYELAKNPSKLVTLDMLAQRSPKQAQAEMAKLARSITDNRQAQQDASQQGVNAPLDRMQPSRVSGSNGKMGISDLRSQPWLRG